MTSKWNKVTKYVFWFSIGLAIVFVILCITAIITSCDEDNCLHGEKRCSGDQEQICDADEDWVRIRNCGGIFSITNPRQEWVCCELPDAGAECTMKENCINE